MHLRRSQKGLAAAAVIIVIIVVAVVLAFGRSLVKSSVTLGQRAVTESNLRKITDALVQFASLTQRLPCPARGDTDSGNADPDASTTACNSADGVVPWRTLSLPREAAIDGWGRKISYRVFSGATGFTHDGSVNMTSCNSSLGAPIDPTMDAGSKCKSGTPPPNSPSQFLAARSPILVVEDSGTTRNGNAFVLISHGESGYGAYVAEGAAGRTTLPNAAGREFTNMQSAGTYWILSRSDPSVVPTDPAHYDDVVAYLSASDLAIRAKLGARTWSEFPLSAQFSASAVEAAVATAGGSFDASTSQNTGMSSLGMGGFLITATSAGTTRNIGFREQDGIGGIGVIGGSSTSGDINSAFGEKLTFQLGEASEFGKMDVALNAFQITDASPLRKERAEISFWKAGQLVQTATVDAWDFQSNPARCLVRLVSGGTFDRMDVAAVEQTNFGGSSRFTVAGIMACTDPTTPCQTSIAGAVACAIAPPSASTGAASSIGAVDATVAGGVEDNGIAMGTGSGYRVPSSFFGYGFGTTSLPLTTGAGTILAGNCLTLAGDANTYVVATGISAPGTLVLADPGLRQSIPAFTTRNVTVTHCQTAVTFDYGTTLAFGSSAAASPATIDAGSSSTPVSASIAGLTCNTTYYFRTRATSIGATTTGNHQSFTTGPCP